jgi:hypothetical protein
MVRFTLSPPPLPFPNNDWIDEWACLKSGLETAEEESMFYTCRELKPDLSVVQPVA